MTNSAFVEILGGPEDGKLMAVTEQVIKSGVLRRIKPFNVRAYEQATDVVEWTEDPHETWVIRKWYNPQTKTFKVKAIEEGMWKRLNS